jgi:membrane peptidoglycan carboxypeptidase
MGALEPYLNVAHWGPDMAGVEAPPLRYCIKPTDQLTWGEAALLTIQKDR